MGSCWRGRCGCPAGGPARRSRRRRTEAGWPVSAAPCRRDGPWPGPDRRAARRRTRPRPPRGSATARTRRSCNKEEIGASAARTSGTRPPAPGCRCPRNGVGAIAPRADSISRRCRGCEPGGGCPCRDLRISILSGVSYRSRLLRRLALAAPLVFILLVPVPALAAGSGLDPLLPGSVSPNGQRLFDLYNIISIPALIVFVLVEALLLTIVIRDRRRRLGPNYRPPQWHGNTRLEVAWTVAPFLLMIGIGALSFTELQRDFQRPFGSPSDLQIDISAHQFGWNYSYPQGFTISSEGNTAVQPLVVPTGRLVRLKIDSVDVIHSWWVTDIAGKTDAVPGYDNFAWFNIQQVGQYRGECDELCGAGHYSMQIMVKAVTQDDFDAWVADQQAKQKASPSPSPSPASAPARPSPSPSASASPSPSPSR